MLRFSAAGRVWSGRWRYKGTGHQNVAGPGFNASWGGMTWNYRLLGLLSILMNNYEGIAPIGIDKGSIKVEVAFSLSTT